MVDLVSLGMSCQTTHQITLFTENNPSTTAFVKGPFDWIISPPTSTARWLEQDLRDFKLTELTEHKDHAYWPTLNLWFWHGFLDRTGSSPKLQLAKLAENELSKLNHLRQNFKSLDLSTTHFILSNTQNNLTTEVFQPDESESYQFDEATIDSVQLALDRFFGKPTNLAVITRTDRCTPALTHRHNVHLLPIDESNWKGDKKQWSKLLWELAGYDTKQD